MEKLLEFRLRYSPACGCDPIESISYGASAEDVMDDLVDEGTSHPLGFFYLKLAYLPPVDEFELLDYDGTCKYRFRTGWLRLRLWFAELRRLDVAILNGRLFHRGEG